MAFSRENSLLADSLIMSNLPKYLIWQEMRYYCNYEKKDKTGDEIKLILKERQLIIILSILYSFVAQIKYTT